MVVAADVDRPPLSREQLFSDFGLVRLELLGHRRQPLLQFRILGLRRQGLGPVQREVEGAPAVVELIDFAGRRAHVLQVLGDRLIERLLKVADTRLNGHPVHRLPQNANVSFRFVEGESLLLHLDMRGFAVSTGSACFSRSLEASHVMLGIGGDHERAHGSVRFTFGRYNREQDVDAVAEAVAEVVTDLRRISPLGKERE